MRETSGWSGAEASASGDRGGSSYYYGQRVFAEGESGSRAAECSACVTRINEPKIKMMNGKEMLVFVVSGLGKTEAKNVERNAGFKKINKTRLVLNGASSK